MKRNTAASLVISLTLLLGLSSSLLGAGGCLGFDNLPLGQEYKVGQSFYEAPATVHVRSYENQQGVMTNGSIMVRNTADAGGSGYELEYRGANTLFVFDAPGSRCVMKFGYHNGNINVAINGEYHNLPDLDMLNGHVSSDGVTVHVLRQGNRGTLVFTGTIHSIEIGSAYEFWVDDVCLDPIAGGFGAVYFSVEEEFAQITEDGSIYRIVSDGDLLRSDGTVVMTNADLLAPWKPQADLGLDAVDVFDVEREVLAFSTEVDHPDGRFGHGDLLIRWGGVGAIIPNEALMRYYRSEFDLPKGLDYGLDAVHFVGKADAVDRVLEEIVNTAVNQPVDPGLLIELLTAYAVDIWFSTEIGGPVWDNGPAFLDGDVLSVMNGVVIRNADLLPAAVPAGIPMRGIDYGCDAYTEGIPGPTTRTTEETIVRESSIGTLERVFSSMTVTESASMMVQPAGKGAFSTEILSESRTPFDDGDVLQVGNGILINHPLLIQAFGPQASFLGLDALSVVRREPVACGQFTRVGGVHVNDTLWDYATGYVDPTLAGKKDRPFGRWVSIRGEFADDVSRFRVLFRNAAGQEEPIRLDNWRVYAYGSPTLSGCPAMFGWTLVPFDVDGWVDATLWRCLRSDGNNDMILTSWNTLAKYDLDNDGLVNEKVTDGKYMLILEIEKPDGSRLVCDTLPIQIDNTKPVIGIDADIECNRWNCDIKTFDVKGKIFDVHFDRYRLDINSYWMSPHTVTSGSYTDMWPSWQTGNPSWPGFDVLATVNMPTLLGLDYNKGRYTIILWAWDRSILGSFSQWTNWIKDDADNNWDYDLTNFECI